MPPAKRSAPASPAQVPILETTRLKLRGHRIDDFPASAAMWANPVVTRYIGDTPLSEEESWTKFLRYIGHWDLLGFGYWAVEEKASGNFVGEIGFADYKRDIHLEIEIAPETGWVLVPQFHGQGYATEALQAALAWGDPYFDRNFSLSRTTCLIRPDNLASIRVAEKCGYREFQRTTYKRQPTIAFVR